MNPSHKLNRVIVFSFFAVILILGATSGWAQSAPGTISGQVMDPQGATIAGSEVKLVDTSTNSTQDTTTNELVRYTFICLPPGVYNLTVNHPSFTHATINAL